MEPSQLERQQLRELLTNRIQAGEQLRRELAALFDESARSILGPATDDLRSASRAALDDLRLWRASAAELMRELEGQSSSALRDQARALQQSWEILQSELRRSVETLKSDLGRESSTLSERYSTTSGAVHSALDRMEPAIQDTLHAADQIRSSVLAAVSESGDLLRTISDRGIEEARRSAAHFEEALRPLLDEFTEQNVRAYSKFEANSGEFLSLQRKQAAETSTGFSAMQEEVAQFASSATSKVDKLSSVVLEEIQRSREASVAVLSAINGAEARLSQTAAAELKRTKSTALEMGTQLLTAIQELDRTIRRVSSDIELRDTQAARMAGLRFWLLIALAVVVTVVLATVMRH